jgi:hypothetical protein
VTSTDIQVKIHQAIEAARQSGEPRPGRPTLVKLTGATDYQVRKILAKLATSEVIELPDPSVAPGAAGETPAGSSTGLATTTDQLSPTNTRLPKPWPLVIIGLAAAVAVWGGWVRLGELTGFGPINLLPGIGRGFTLNTAVVLPLSVEFYSAYALRVLLASGRLSAKVRNFAKRSFIASLSVGGGAQIASHVMGAANVATAPWPVTTLVACVPLLVIGLATGLATLVRSA